MDSDALDAGLADYLRTNRDFLAPAVADAVAALNLRDAVSVLDAGTGGGGAIVALASATAPTGHVLAVDRNPAVGALAMEFASRFGVADRTTFRSDDLAAVLAEAVADPGRAFDVIWASDVVWPGNFDDPARIVDQMGQALRPGGILALFYSNYYQSTFLPGHSRLERLLRTASEMRWGLPGSGPTHYERHLAWLLASGLTDVRLRVFPRVGFPVDDDPTVRAYLESSVWPELRQSADACGVRAGLSGADLREALALVTPGDSGYVMNEPGFFVMHPTILATGTRPQC